MRPYISVIVKLIRKIVEMANYANVCRDARLVRPPLLQLIVSK